MNRLRRIIEAWNNLCFSEKYVAVVVLLILLVILILGLTAEGSRPYVVRDKVTGCEYLVNPRGGITPRLDGIGRQVCSDTLLP